MNKILIIEDDITLREELALFLTNNGYEVICIDDFSNTLDSILDSNVDLILMDITIPGYKGDYLTKEIRKVSDIPIIMVTSSKNEMSELLCITYGADDYIVKPYNPQILLVRIEAIFKRINKTSMNIKYKDIILDISKSILIHNNITIELSKNESKILYYLLKKQGNIVTREDIMDYLWGNEQFVDDNTLTVNITRIRKKLSDLGYNNMIETRRSQGYIIL